MAETEETVPAPEEVEPPPGEESPPESQPEPPVVEPESLPKPEPKKRGRPPGARNKVKVERTPAPPPPEPTDVPITAVAESIIPPLATAVPTPAFKRINFGDQMRDRLRTLHQRESQKRVDVLQRFMRT